MPPRRQLTAAGAAFMAVNASFFMGLYFMISASFVPS